MSLSNYAEDLPSAEFLEEARKLLLEPDEDEKEKKEKEELDEVGTGGVGSVGTGDTSYVVQDDPGPDDKDDPDEQKSKPVKKKNREDIIMDPPINNIGTVINGIY